MTEHYTMQEAVELARECGAKVITTADKGCRNHEGIHCPCWHEEINFSNEDELHTLINTAVTRKLAEKELEVVRLRELIDAASWNIKCVSCDPDGAVSMNGSEEDVRIMQNGLNLLDEALSTPPSTEALDEYVAARMAESEDRRDAERLDCIRKLCGYVEDGSDQTVRIFQDDATRDWFVEVGQFGRPKTKGSGRSFKAAIDAAIEAEKGRG